jgi:hypothetical protein
MSTINYTGLQKWTLFNVYPESIVLQPLKYIFKILQMFLPRIDNIFATLAGGRKFTKLDIRQTYLHMPLDEDSKKWLAINTHKGLYEYKPVFHVHNKLHWLAKMNTFQCLPGVHCPATFEVHLQNFANVHHHFFLWLLVSCRQEHTVHELCWG